MKFVKILSLILFTSASFISCSEDSVNPENIPQDNFTYPFSINSFWYYGTRNFVTNLRPDSLSSVFSTDTISGYGGATFLKDTIINNDTLRLFRNSHSDESHSHTTLELFKQTDSGLIRHAFYSDGTNFGPFRNEKKYKFSMDLSGARLDSFGYTILKGGRKHRVSFKEDLCKVIKVENWKSYNIDSTYEKKKCSCNQCIII